MSITGCSDAVGDSRTSLRNWPQDSMSLSCYHYGLLELGVQNKPDAPGTFPRTGSAPLAAVTAVAYTDRIADPAPSLPKRITCAPGRRGEPRRQQLSRALAGGLLTAAPPPPMTWLSGARAIPLAGSLSSVSDQGGAFPDSTKAAKRIDIRFEMLI